MKLTSAQKAAKLRDAAQEVIARLLRWEEEHSAPNLTQIEDEVLALRQRFGEEMVAVLVAGQEAQQPVATPKCEQCGAGACYGVSRAMGATESSCSVGPTYGRDDGWGDGWGNAASPSRGVEGSEDGRCL